MPVVVQSTPLLQHLTIEITGEEHPIEATRVPALVGVAVPATAVFRNHDGAVFDPDTVTLAVKAPDGRTESHSFSDENSPITHEALGEYRALVSPDQPGLWGCSERASTIAVASSGVTPCRWGNASAASSSGRHGTGTARETGTALKPHGRIG